VSPSEFIPLAEDAGLIVPIGRWVLEEACRQAARWASAFPGRPALVVSANVSGRQFDSGLVELVAHALAAARLNPALLCLEVTESTVMTDVQSTIGILGECKELGVGVSVDDFGTGYSSLAYLKRFPLNEVKVDRSFVDGLGHDPEDTAIVAAVMGMAHALELDVVAEGVETEEQLARLRSLGCDLAQGYYFARPGPATATEALLAAEAAASWSGRDAERVADEADPSYRSPTVVVADDAADVRQLARLSLAAAGFEVHEAANGTEAIELVRRMKPDCVVLDVSMGDISGFEVCRVLRVDPAGAACTIVMLTADADAAGKVQGFSAGADDYIVKPFAPRELVQRLQTAMRRRQESSTELP
jgi:EAL domain-containing protein (putative c-di-GMP-specific phosphodiesterase class I)/CheY-like chemotaxis protein